MTKLILPGTLEYQIALDELPLPPDWERWAARTNGNFSIVVIPGTGGIMHCVEHRESAEFVGDGHFDTVCEEVDAASPFTWASVEDFAELLAA